ncbi:hypothetical protein [uncultured Metabacillus sp.]|uniref:hypothetical protein n=1 Tax=uncultured Metabacillus sp. TaxID=2860135 RepID=UPI00261AFFED|nr:hypothetical protein [uncultured Metabacillus sp.]
MEHKKILNGGFVDSEKLDVLHKRETVLSNKDTERLLKAIDKVGSVIGVEKED